jgi:hypothetical protein
VDHTQQVEKGIFNSLWNSSDTFPRAMVHFLMKVHLTIDSHNRTILTTYPTLLPKLAGLQQSNKNLGPKDICPDASLCDTAEMFRQLQTLWQPAPVQQMLHMRLYESTPESFALLQ